MHPATPALNIGDTTPASQCVFFTAWYVTNPVIELPCGSKNEGVIHAFSNPKLNKAYFQIKESNCNLGAWSAFLIYTELTVTHLTITGKIMRKNCISIKKRTFTVKMGIYFRILTIKILI